MTYFMPTRIIEEDEVVRKHSDIFKATGTKALIVTGRNSAKINGAQEDVLWALSKEGIEYVIFDQVIENPPIEQISEGAAVGKGCDFVIGIGGGSPIDAAKGMAVLIAHPEVDAFEMLYKRTGSEALPVLAIPTTGGTGTETTPYAIFTDHKLKTKTSMSQKVFPVYALMDVKYYMHMPVAIRNSTCVDALTHSIESYMNTNASKYSDYIALESIRLWGGVKESLKKDALTTDEMKVFMNASSFAGMAISQTGTSIAHSMGYPLTYNHGLAHGKANAVFMASYLEFCKDKKKVKDILDGLGFETLKAFDTYLKAVVGDFNISEEEIQTNAVTMMSNKRKLKNHPDPIAIEDVVRMYRESVGATHE